MVHSVELTFDADTDAAVRGVWDALAEAGVRSQAAHRGPSNRPHVTLTVAAHVSGEVDRELTPLLDALPLTCRIGAPILFGRGPFTLALLVVPSADVLGLHAEAHRICLPHCASGAYPHARPGEWTPHVTLARRLDAALLDRAMPIAAAGAEIAGAFVGLRHWDGDAKRECWIS